MHTYPTKKKPNQSQEDANADYRRAPRPGYPFQATSHNKGRATHQNAHSAQRRTPPQPPLVPYPPFGYKVGPADLCEEARGNVAECYDTLWGGRRNEVEGGREYEDIKDCGDR